MKTKLLILILITFSTVMIFTSFDAEAQCSMCTASAKNSANEGGIGAGLNKGVLYLMAVPYLLAAVFGILWYRRNKSVK